MGKFVEHDTNQGGETTDDYFIEIQNDGFQTDEFQTDELSFLDEVTDEFIEDSVLDNIETESVEDIPQSEEVNLCTPGALDCNDTEGQIYVCNSSGTAWERSGEICDFGCTDTPEVHCLDFYPSNISDISLLCAGSADFNPSGARYVVFDSDTGKISSYDANWNNLPNIRNAGTGNISGINYTVITQSGGAPSLGVFSFNSFNIPAGIDVYLIGSESLEGNQSNALVILVCGDVIISGKLHADAIYIGNPYYTVVPGAGGGTTDTGTGRGNRGTSGSSYYSGGGGGGGFGGSGGSGGTSWGGSGGATYGNPELIPLYGGSGGGSGADNYYAGYGGPSGGAVQISAKGDFRITSGGVITANGWGGSGASYGGGGGGGGSGGGVLIEAKSVTIESGGIITANGGGGGGGSSGSDGERGREDLNPANGGRGGDYGCDGSPGNSSTEINGASNSCSDYNGGGGGGGAGRIRLNSLIFEIQSGAIISPSLSASPTSSTTGNIDLR